jgi:hypothetical protein
MQFLTFHIEYLPNIGKNFHYMFFLFFVNLWIFLWGFSFFIVGCFYDYCEKYMISDFMRANSCFFVIYFHVILMDDIQMLVNIVIIDLMWTY